MMVIFCFLFLGMAFFQGLLAFFQINNAIVMHFSFIGVLGQGNVSKYDNWKGIQNVLMQKT